MGRHTFVPPIAADDDPDVCFDCGSHRSDEEHQPAPDLPEPLAEAIATTLEALSTLAAELHRAGARDSSIGEVSHFCHYHLADVEGNDSGAGWLGGPYLADALRALSSEEN